MENTRFKKGQIPWNKGTKGVMKQNKTSFKKGEHRSVKTEFKKGEMSGKQMGENNSSYKHGKYTQKWCIDCGKKLKRKTAIRCKECYGKFIKGENHWNWRGGKTLEKYPSDWTNKLRDSIRDRDEYVCDICGIHQDELDGHFKRLDVHHIDYDKYNLNPNNLITLCHSCHTKTNTNRRYWIEYFNN